MKKEESDSGTKDASFDPNIITSFFRHTTTNVPTYTSTHHVFPYSRMDSRSEPHAYNLSTQQLFLPSRSWAVL